MSAKPVVLDAVLRPFIAAGLRVTVQGNYLMVHDVPVVDNQRRLTLGTLASTFIYTDSQVTPPATHQAWFAGPFPCFADGTPMEQLRHSDVPGGMVAPDVPANFYFSNKDEGWTGYNSHFDLMMHYWRIITDQARVIDLNCTSSLGLGEIQISQNDGPFRYPDACSARGNFAMASQRLANLRVAIIGLGGTGSYILDQVAKTPVQEIHLFDGDNFELHNAFRAPAAARESDFGRPKVSYLAELYSHMRMGIVEHSSYVTEENVGLLGQFDFVFVCVDRGPARKLICSHLINQRVPFIDCGMDMSLSDAQQIFGTCRVTLATPAKNEHFFDRAPTMEDAGDALYNQNIQISDANSLNAIFAVIRWKQYFGFYAMNWDWHHLEYAVSAMALAKAERLETTDAN